MQAPCIDACILIAGPTLLILMALCPRQGWGGATLPFLQIQSFKGNSVKPSLEHGGHTWFQLVVVKI